MPPLAPPDPPLADDLVTLRPLEPGDLDDVVALMDGEPGVVEFLPEIPQPYGVGDGRAFVESSRAGWAVGDFPRFALLLDGRFAGQLGLRLEWSTGAAEIGFCVGPLARGRGVATRATRLVTEWAFALGFERVQIKARTDNVASQRVAERAGYTREGVLRALRRHPLDGRRQDFVLYSRLRDD